MGNATAKFFCQKSRKKQMKILVCRDARISSKAIKGPLVKSIIEHGDEVIDAAIGTTPFFYFLMRVLKPDGGIMITASHNPPEWAGFKIRGRNGSPVSLGTGLEQIKKSAVARKYSKAKTAGMVTMLPGDWRNKYLDFLAEDIKIGKLRAVVDAGGGSAGLFLPDLLNKFPAVIYKPLFFEPDGSFQKHPPNPLLPEARQFVQKELARGIFQFGAIFDGDGDRVVFFDEKGNGVNPEFIFLFFALEELKKNPRSKFALPVDASKNIREVILEKGGKIKLCRRGYTFVKRAMQEADSPLSVEKSGHFFFRKFSYDDSALLAFLRLANFLSQSRRPLSQLVKPLGRYFSPPEFSFPTKDKTTAMARVKKFYKNAPMSLLDGVSVEFSDWWFNLRPSNTEEVVRLVVEAKNEKLFKEKLKELEGLIKNG